MRESVTRSGVRHIAKTALVFLLVGWFLLVQQSAHATDSGPEDTAAEEGRMQDRARTLVDFSDPEELERWGAINDGVMGGLSEGRIVASSDGTAFFAGILSLENNGGFASVRRAPQPYGLEDADALILHAKGDGRRYQFRIRTDDRFDGVAYQASFETPAGEWQWIEIPFDRFRATFRERSVPEVGALDPRKIRQIGFMLADKRPGPFRLEVRTIGARLDSTAVSES